MDAVLDVGRYAGAVLLFIVFVVHLPTWTWATRALFAQLAVPLAGRLRGEDPQIHHFRRWVAVFGIYLLSALAAILAFGAVIRSPSNTPDPSFWTLPITILVGLAFAATARVIALRSSVAPVHELTLTALPALMAILWMALLVPVDINESFDILRLSQMDTEYAVLPWASVLWGAGLTVLMVFGTEISLGQVVWAGRRTASVPLVLLRERLGLFQHASQVISRGDVTATFCAALTNATREGDDEGTARRRVLRELYWVTQSASADIVKSVRAILLRQSENVDVRVICYCRNAMAIRASLGKKAEVRAAHRIGTEHFMVINADSAVIAGPVPPILDPGREDMQTSNLAFASNDPILVHRYRVLFCSWWDSLEKHILGRGDVSPYHGDGPHLDHGWPNTQPPWV